MKINSEDTSKIDYSLQHNFFDAALKNHVQNADNNAIQSQNGYFSSAARFIKSAIVPNKNIVKNADTYPLLPIAEHGTTSSVSLTSLASSQKTDSRHSSAETLPGMQGSHFSLSNTLVDPPSASKSTFEKLQEFFPDSSTYEFKAGGTADGRTHFTSFTPSAAERAKAIKEKGEQDFIDTFGRYVEERNYSLLNPIKEDI